MDGDDIIVTEKDGYSRTVHRRFNNDFCRCSVARTLARPAEHIPCGGHSGRGSVLIRQKMFESRLFFVDKLIDMGARIILCDPHRAAVIGSGRLNSLHATDMISPTSEPELRCFIAALSGERYNRIQNIDQIDRGYERIDERLNRLGARIIRVDR